MSEDNKGVEPVEETTTTPPVETKPEEPQVEEPSTEEPESSPESTEVESTPVEEKKEEPAPVPYDRFKDVVAEKNKYKELLSTIEDKPAPAPTPPQMKQPDYDEGDDQINVINPLVKQVVSQEMSKMQKQAELDRTISRTPDFFNYADSIKAKITENPHLSWDDAYRLAKFDSVATESREIGRQEVTRSTVAKKTAGVESAAKTKPAPGPTGQIDPMAKGPDGKFLFSTKELEDILPKAA